MKDVLFSLLLLSLAFPLNAQENIYTQFEAGKKFYLEDENYSEAYQQFNEVQEALGEPKLRLQPWLVKAAFQIRKYNEANQHLQAYMSLNPNIELVEYQEMQEYSNRLQRILQRSKAEYERLMDITDTDRFIRALKNYADKYQDGQYRDILFGKVKDMDQEAFDNINPNDFNSINSYLKRFTFKINDDLSNPGSYYHWTPSNEEEALVLKDDYYFKQAVRKGTLQAYDNYLSYEYLDRENSNYRQIELLKDDHLYQEAIRKGTIFAYNDYLTYNQNYEENNNYEEIERLLKEAEIASIREKISWRKETLRSQRKRAAGYYFKGIFGLGLAGASGYYLYDIYVKSENRGLELSEKEEYIGYGAAVGLGIGLVYFYNGFDDGGTWSRSARMTKNEIRDLENDIRQLSLIPHLNPFNESYHLTLRISF